MESANETFVYGAELSGRGAPTSTDKIVGSIIFTLAFLAVVLGIYNLYLIKKMKVFHNAFGWFWASRTVGEIGSNLVHVVYSGPMTLMQPVLLSPTYGIVAFTIGYFFACHACVMHQVVSVNRLFAVCMPLKYRFIFTKSVCKILIAICWIEVVFVALAYLVIPCNMVGFSPQLYEYVFVKCDADLKRDYSIVGTVINRFCFGVCLITMLSDLITLAKIIQIKRAGNQSKDFQRDVRFFCQTSVQNITMMIALTMIVIVNNSKSSDGTQIMQILAFCTLIMTHVNNTLALIIFNPEVRNRIFKRSNVSTTKAAESSRNSNATHHRTDSQWH